MQQDLFGRALRLLDDNQNLDNSRTVSCKVAATTAKIP